MRLSSILINNFRNLQEFEMSLSAFEILVGENNVGKTNILHAIKKILLEGRSVNIVEEDFGDPGKPLIIEFTFSNFSKPEEEAIFFDIDGLKNPETDEVKIRVKAELDKNTGSVEHSSVFIREDLPEDEQEIKNFYKYHKEYVPFYYIPAYREIRKELSSKNGDIFKILKSFAPYHLMPIQNLRKSIFGIFKEMKNQIDQIGSEEESEELSENLNGLKSNFEDMEDSDEIIECSEIFNTVKQDIKMKFKGNEEKTLTNKVDELEDLLSKYQNRIIIQKKLGSIKEELRTLYELENLEEEINDMLSEVLVDENIVLSTILSDEDFFKQLKVNMGEYSILKQGDGYQNILSLILKLFKSISIKKLKESEIRNFIVAIEEPESHLHPHLQRHLIRALKNIQKKFLDNDITLQFIMTTHSPFVISPLSLNSLTFIRKSEDISPFAIKINEDKFVKDIVDQLGLTNETKIRRRKEGINKLLEHLVNNRSEVFFSRCIIVGEGETEEGAIPIFGEKIIKGLDRSGISFLNIQGEGNLNYCTDLLSKLEIPHVLIIDKDMENKYSSLSNAFFVGGGDPKGAFEHEILLESPFEKIIKSLSDKSPDKDEHRIANLKGELEVIRGCEFESLEETLDYLDEDDYEEIKPLVLKWMKKEKSVLFGRILAKNLEIDEIPETFRKAVKCAADLLDEGDVGNAE